MVMVVLTVDAKHVILIMETWYANSLMLCEECAEKVMPKKYQLEEGNVMERLERECYYI